MSGTMAAQGMLCEKIRAAHRDRLAVVYVRQSTLQQRTRHQESTRLQYGLVERAVALGWLRARIEVIDEDLGKSGATAEDIAATWPASHTAFLAAREACLLYA